MFLCLLFIHVVGARRELDVPFEDPRVRLLLIYVVVVQSAGTHEVFPELD